MNNDQKTTEKLLGKEALGDSQREVKIDEKSEIDSLIKLLEDDIFVEILVRCDTDEEMKYLFAAKGCKIRPEQLDKIKQSFAEIAKKLKSLSKKDLKELNSKLQTLSDYELEDLSAGGVEGAILGSIGGAICTGTVGLVAGFIKGGIDASHEIKNAETSAQKAKVVGKVFLKALAGLGIGVGGGALSGAAWGNFVPPVTQKV